LDVYVQNFEKHTTTYQAYNFNHIVRYLTFLNSAALVIAM